MLFNSHVFLFAFLPIVFTIFWSARGRQARYLILTIASYVFYGWWDWRFCSLLLLSSALSFFGAQLIDREPAQHRRKAWTIAFVSIDLAILAFFKYYNFAVSNINSMTESSAFPQLVIALPIGISFYTFHTISYLIDTYRKVIVPTKNLLEYLTYVSLFSQLVAGPIVRFRQIESDLRTIDGPIESDLFARGIGLFVVGLVKKVVIADTLARWTPGLPVEGPPSAFEAWSVAFSFAFQLYFDFSGYSDMAMGLGLLFGFHIPPNFDAPYQARSVQEFWRRWHISLSTWFRDYLYIPLGGSRGGVVRTSANLLITMLLVGLWHGANWTFVVWGAFHGSLLVAERGCGRWLEAVPVLVRRGITFVLVVVGFEIFAAPSLTEAGRRLGWLLGVNTGSTIPSTRLLILVTGCFVVTQLVPETWRLRLGTRPRWAVAYATAFVAAYLFMNGRETVFLYFQF